MLDDDLQLNFGKADECGNNSIGLQNYQWHLTIEILDRERGRMRESSRNLSVRQRAGAFSDKYHSVITDGRYSGFGGKWGLMVKY